ncbi:MAG: prepilin-type N-terminal cleavage/methylation domain-containing protein, partial [Candidatus Omnitrophica bacterium]|nr:prepilin-type N-terminal cleavage/methylation domain-containing protein [Candidatus Omnitrophota bacterium]
AGVRDRPRRAISAASSAWVRHRSFRKKGFTLVELMVVVIIVGILASVAVPIYRANIKKAMASEGAALLGSVLTAQRIYYAENNTYTTTKANLGVDTIGNKYFTDYTVNSADANGFTASTTGTGAADGVTVTMIYTNAAGATITYSGL